MHQEVIKMKVNELEKLLGISRANIRFYESEGFIKPHRGENGYRNYSDEDIAILKKVIVYRKLGLSIAQIKDVFGGSISLTEAVIQSIENLENSIATQNIAIAICEEIKTNNVSNEDFDTDTYLNKISNYESEGEEFIDIAGIDISPYKKQKGIRILIVILIILFFFGIAYSFIANNAFILNDNENYKLKLPEINTADTIDTVKTDPDNDRIYVFYDEAGCINTYNFEGEFVWAVSVPYIKDRDMCYFYLKNNEIIFDNRGTVFKYNAITGDFIGKDYAEDLGLYTEKDNYDLYHKQDIESDRKCGVAFDIYNVYFIDQSGNIIKYIVSKPMVTVIKSTTFGFIISLLSGLALAVIAYLSRLKGLKSIKVIEEEVGMRAKRFKLVLLIVSAVYILIAVLNILFSIFGLPSIAISIFPAAFSFIILLITNSVIKTKMNKSELKITGTAMHYCVISFTLLFISVLIYTIFFQ